MLKMSITLVLGATLLCVSEWMSKVNATPRLGTQCPCPHRSNTKIQLKKVVNYTIQYEGICPIKVLMVHTLSGITLCSNPDTKWAELVIFKVNMDRVRKELQESALIKVGPSSTIAPTPAKATDSQTKKRVKCLKKNLKKKSRKGRNRAEMSMIS